jgi:hypothetical protein
MSQSNNHSHQQQYQARNQSQPARNPQEQRREFLWRERVKLEMQVQALIARSNSLAQEWHLLQNKKAGLAQQKPQVAAHILFSGLAGMRNLPSERLFHYQKERLMQEEYRIQQAIICCNNDAAGLQAQISVIDVELSLL